MKVIYKESGTLTCGECGYPLKDLRCPNIECHKYDHHKCPICGFPKTYEEGNQFCICDMYK